MYPQRHSQNRPGLFIQRIIICLWLEYFAMCKTLNVLRHVSKLFLVLKRNRQLETFEPGEIETRVSEWRSVFFAVSLQFTITDVRPTYTESFWSLDTSNDAPMSQIAPSAPLTLPLFFPHPLSPRVSTNVLSFPCEVVVRGVSLWMLPCSTASERLTCSGSRDPNITFPEVNLDFHSVRAPLTGKKKHLQQTFSEVMYAERWVKETLMRRKISLRSQTGKSYS